MSALTILPPFSVAINAVISDVDSTKTRLSLQPSGGQGKLLAASWTCPDGQTPQGLTVADSPTIAMAMMPS